MPSPKKNSGNVADAKAKPHVETKPIANHLDSYDKKTCAIDHSNYDTNDNPTGMGSAVSVKQLPTIDPKALKDIFRFLYLPAEIWNQIYRNLLAVYTPTYVQNPSYYDLPSESQPLGGDDIDLVSVPIGTVRCHTPRINISKFYVSILRVNRQIYREASDIFYMENTWISVHVNKAGVGRMLKDHGFAPMRCSTISRPRYSSMSVAIIFPSLLEHGETDSFVMSPTGIGELPRALWTMKGVEEMCVVINILSDVAGHPLNELKLIGPFVRLRGISKAIVCGAHMKRWNTYLPYLMRSIHSGDGEIMQYLQTIAGRAYTSRNDKNYKEAEIAFEEVLSHLSDCYKVYVPGLFGYPDDVLSDEIIPLAVNIALDLAEVKNELGCFHHAIKYSTYAITITPLDDTTTAPVLLARGRAYVGLNQEKLALKDLLSAKRMAPQDAQITLEITQFKKRLYPDPVEALKAHKNLCLAIKNEGEENFRANLVRAHDLMGDMVVATPKPDGSFTVRDRF